MSTNRTLESLQVYRFLSAEVAAYLPPYETVSVFHLRDLCAKRRRILKCTDIKVMQLPHYDGLFILDLLGFAENYQNGSAMEALPLIRKETLKLPRGYIANVIFSIVGQPFADFVKSQIDARNNKIKHEQSMNIEMDPEIADIFRASTSISSK